MPTNAGGMCGGSRNFHAEAQTDMVFGPGLTEVRRRDDQRQKVSKYHGRSPFCCIWPGTMVITNLSGATQTKLSSCPQFQKYDSQNPVTGRHALSFRFPQPTFPMVHTVPALGLGTWAHGERRTEAPRRRSGPAGRHRCENKKRGSTPGGRKMYANGGAEGSHRLAAIRVAR